MTIVFVVVVFPIVQKDCIRDLSDVGKAKPEVLGKAIRGLINKGPKLWWSK